MQHITYYTQYASIRIMYIMNLITTVCNSNSVDGPYYYYINHVVRHRFVIFHTIERKSCTIQYAVVPTSQFYHNI